MRACAIAIVLLIASLARAAPGMRPEAAAQRELGLREYAVGKWAEAIAAVRAAYELDPQPELLYALAQAQRKSGDCASATASYRAFLRTSPPEAPSATARQNLERCEASLAQARVEEQRRSRATARLPPYEEAHKRGQSALPPVDVARRPWQRDVAAAVLVGVGGAVAGAGGALWGVNVPRFGLQRYALLFWLGPGLVGGLAIVLWTRHYRRKHQPRVA